MQCEWLNADKGGAPAWTIPSVRVVWARPQTEGRVVLLQVSVCMREKARVGGKGVALVHACCTGLRSASATLS